MICCVFLALLFDFGSWWLLIAGLLVCCCFLLRLWAGDACGLLGFSLGGLWAGVCCGLFLVVCLIVIAVRVGFLVVGLVWIVIYGGMQVVFSDWLRGNFVGYSLWCIGGLVCGGLLRLWDLFWWILFG